jgi:hypothetical protein
MKKSQIKMLQEMLKDKDIKGKKQLERVLWLNTSTPKYKVGQCVKVTDYGHSVYGHRVIDFKAKIVSIRADGWNNQYLYEMEMDITCGDKHTTVMQYSSESVLKGGVRNNLNVLPSPKNENSSAISVSI